MKPQKGHIMLNKSGILKQSTFFGISSKIIKKKQSILKKAKNTIFYSNLVLHFHFVESRGLMKTIERPASLDFQKKFKKIQQEIQK